MHERVRGEVKLLEVYGVVHYDDDGRLVVVLVAVVGGTEDGDHGGEERFTPVVHLVALQLGLVRPDDREDA